MPRGSNWRVFAVFASLAVTAGAFGGEVLCWIDGGEADLCDGCEDLECRCTAQSCTNAAVRECAWSTVFVAVPQCEGYEIEPVEEVPCFADFGPCRWYPNCVQYPVNGYCLSPVDPTAYSGDTEWTFCLGNACCP